MTDDTDDRPVRDEPIDRTLEGNVDGSEGPDDASDEPDGMAGAAVEEIDGRLVDLLSWILDTETRAKIYVFLLANPGSTSEEVAQGTGLYPSTVREALAELHDEETVDRKKRASEGAGNNPYEYTAIKPSELVGGAIDQVQQELNTIFNLDRILDRGETIGADAEPVTITVDETDDPVDAEAADAGETFAPEEIERPPDDPGNDDSDAE